MTTETENMEGPAERDDALAAEYVLGVLSAPERQQLAVRIDKDAAFARLVARWEDTLLPLATEVQPVQPPESVWTGLESALFDDAAAAVVSTGWWSSLPLWRGLAFAAMLFAAAALLYPTFGLHDAADVPRLTATLQSDQTADRFVASYDQGGKVLVLSALSTVPQPDQVYELWLIEGDIAPVSLGVVPGGRSVLVPLTPVLREKLRAGNLLAVSLEPRGGSTTGAPTGPVVAAGKLGVL